MPCDHEITRSVVRTEVDFEGDEYSWVDEEVIMTVVDIDVHRYMCTQCKKVMYYSLRAKQHFEEGMIFPEVIGLNIPFKQEGLENE